MADKKDQKYVGAAAQLDWSQELCLGSLPETARGYGLPVYYSPHLGGVITYGSGNLAFIRNVKNPAICDTFTSNEHKGRITVVSIAPNGEWIASGDDTGTVLIWGSRPGQHNIKLNVKVNKRVWDIAWSSDSMRVCAVGDGAEQKAKVFDWASGNNLGGITGHSKTILSCAFKPQRPFKVVTAGEDLSVSLFEGPPFKWQTSNTGLPQSHTRAPSCVRFHPSGDWYASVGADSKVIIYSAKDGKPNVIDCKDNHKSTITSIAFNGDGKKFMTASMDKTVKLWSFDSKDGSAAVTQTYSFAAKPAVSDMQVSVLFAGDDTPLSVSLSGAINYLDESNPKQPKQVVMGHSKSVRGFGVDRKAGVAFTTCDDGAIAKWDIGTGVATWFTGCPRAFDSGSAIPVCAPTADGAKLVTAGMDDKFRFHDIKAGAYNVNGTAMGGEPTGIATAKKDAGLAAVTLAQEKLIVVREAKVLSTTALGYRPNCVSFSSDDKELAVGGNDSKVRLYSVGADGKVALTKTLDGHVNKVLAVSYSPDNTFIASCDSNRQIIIWKGGVQQNNTGWTFHNANPLDLSWPSNNDKLATCASDQDIIIWSDLKAFEHTFQRIVLAHPSGVEHVSFVSDEKLISSGADRCVRIWKYTAPKK